MSISGLLQLFLPPPLVCLTGGYLQQLFLRRVGQYTLIFDRLSGLISGRTMPWRSVSRSSRGRTRATPTASRWYTISWRARTSTGVQKNVAVALADQRLFTFHVGKQGRRLYIERWDSESNRWAFRWLDFDGFEFPPSYSCFDTDTCLIRCTDIDQATWLLYDWPSDRWLSGMMAKFARLLVRQDDFIQMLHRHYPLPASGGRGRCPRAPIIRQIRVVELRLLDD